MQVKFGALSIGLAICLATSASYGASAVQWQPSLERAQVVAAHSNRLVLLHFWGNGCRPCAWMEREVFTRADVASAIDRNFVAVKISKDQFPGIARQFGVAAVPTDVIITPQGQVLGSYVGQTPPADFINRLGQLAQRFAPPPSQQYAAQGPTQAAPPNAYAQGYGPQNNSMPLSNPNAAYAGGGQPMNQPPSPYQPNTIPGGQPFAAQAAPPYSEQYAAGQNPNQTPAQSGTNASGLNPYAANTYPSNSAMAPATSMADPSAQFAHSPAAQGTQADAAVESNPPLALDGFCPVSLERTMRLDPQPKWIPGDPRWGLRHQGRTYLFAGPEEQQIFYSNPDFYAPVLSCCDVVARVDQGQMVPGLREFGARWRNRVYLFSCRENYAKFQSNPGFYEQEILTSEQAVAARPPVSGQVGGTAANPSHGYR